MKPCYSEVNYPKQIKLIGRFFEKNKKIIGTHDLGEREKGNLIQKLERLRNLMGHLKSFAKSVTVNLNRNMRDYNQVVSKFKNEMEIFKNEREKMKIKTQNPFQITYAKNDKSDYDQMNQNFEMEIVNLRQKIQTLQNENCSLKNVNSLLLEKLKKEETKLSNQFKIAFNENVFNKNCQPVNLKELNQSPTDYFTKNSQVNKSENIEQIKCEIPAEINSQFPIKSDLKNDIYLTTFKHEEILEEEIIKLKSSHFREIQKLKEEFEIKLNKEISEELEKEISVLENQQKVFNQKQSQNAKNELEKTKRIGHLENELNYLKEQLNGFLHHKNVAYSPQNTDSQKSNVGKIQYHENDFKSPLNNKKNVNWIEASLNIDRDDDSQVENMADLRSQIFQLSEQLEEAVETIEQNQLLFQDFKQLREDLENQIKSTREKLESEKTAANFAKTININLENEKKELEQKIQIIAGKTELVIKKLKKKIKKREDLLSGEKSENKRLLGLIEMISMGTEINTANFKVAESQQTKIEKIKIKSQKFKESQN